MAGRFCQRRRFHLDVFLALVFAIGTQGDLTSDLYRMAKQSSYLTELNAATLHEFVTKRQTDSVMVMFHVGSCHICKDALPALDLVAKELDERGASIAVGHVDSTNDKSLQKELGFSGFPAILFWRPGATISEKFQVAHLNGLKARVGSDKTKVLAASRLAGMPDEKDAKRVKALGQEGTIKEVDHRDHTARVELPGAAGSVWLPLEEVSPFEQGEWKAPIVRPEGYFQYRPTSWEQKAMQHFADHMLRKPVVPLQSMKQLTSEMDDERFAAFVLCSHEPSDDFEVVAKQWQDKHLAFHARTAAACPVAELSWPSLVVYSPGSQQWPQKTGRADGRAAAAVAGPEILGAGWASLTAWVASTRFPGVLSVGYENFHEFIQDKQRPSVMIAVHVDRKQENKFVMSKIREAAMPTETEKGPDVYDYGGGGRYWGVCDGSLNGLTQFGISPYSLPRVVLFEGPDSWVEDADELTVASLVTDLQTADNLWRQTNGFKGYLVVFARDSLKIWQYMDGFAVERAGTLGRVFAAVAVAGIVLGSLWFTVKNIIGIAKVLMEGEDTPKKKD